jgi:hypothetical protein
MVMFAVELHQLGFDIGAHLGHDLGASGEHDLVQNFAPIPSGETKCAWSW